MQTKLLAKPVAFFYTGQKERVYMAIKVVKNLVSKLKYGLKCPNPMKAEYITIHNTANDASAANEISYMKNNSSSTSFHFAVDDKQVTQGIPTNRNAWHTGDGTNGTGNRKSISVEICYSKSGGARYKAAEKLAIKFVAQLLKERGWGIDRVRKHQDWNGKYCPHRILSEGRWNQVKAAIEAELKKLGGKTLVALYFYPDKGARITALTECMVRKQQMQLDDSS